MLWCRHHGGIWRSTDNAASSHEITTASVSVFGFAVAVHPRDPDPAWFAPAEADQRRVPVGAAMAQAHVRRRQELLDLARRVAAAPCP